MAALDQVDPPPAKVISYEPAPASLPRRSMLGSILQFSPERVLRRNHALAWGIGLTLAAITICLYTMPSSDRAREGILMWDFVFILMRWIRPRKRKQSFLDR